MPASAAAGARASAWGLGVSGEVAHDTEHALLIKTTAARMPALTARVRALHPYELPELISLPLHPTEGIAAYLDWVTAQTAARGA